MRYKYTTGKVDISFLPEEVREAVSKCFLLSNVTASFIYRYSVEGNKIHHTYGIEEDKYRSSIHQELTLKQFFELEQDHTINIDGKLIRLSQESYEELKRSLEQE